MQNAKTKLIALSALALSFAASAHAAVPTEISDLTTDAGTVWTAVKAIVIGVVAFMVLLAFAKRVTKR